jgi:hypothetical protein
VKSASRLRIEAVLSGIVEDEVEPELCVACARLVGLSGAAIALVTAGAHRTLLCSSDATAAALEDLQNTLGEGPGVDAYRSGVPVVDCDLAASDGSRWLAFAEPALDAGAAAVFAFPLRLGAVRLGSLTFNHRRPGRLSDDQYADARCVAAVATDFVLALQAQAPPGTLTGALAAAADDDAEVHQATGMLSVRLGVTVGDAMVRLRALAYSEGRPLAEVARDVVARGPGTPFDGRRA